MNPSPILLLHIPKLVLDSLCSNENKKSDVIDVPLELVTPRGLFPKTRNPPFEWLFTVAMDSWSLHSILVMDSTLSPVLHSCLKQSVTIIVYFQRRCEQRAMILGLQVHSWQEDWLGTAPKRIENANILGANTAIDTDKVEDLWCPVCVWMQCQK